jgi:hypothetical protein
MAYDRYDSRRGWREPRARFSDEGERFEERGFFERAGDEVASWFGDDEAERRRREDARRLDDDLSRYDRNARYRDEGYRRPYTGRYIGRRGFGDEYDRGAFPERSLSQDRWTPERQREFSGTASGLYDPHYSEWRRRKLDELDRDYDDYRRENQSRFESDFGNWRSQRQGKRQLLGQVREHMTVVGSDEEHVGTVDHVRGDRIILTKSDSDDGQHHLLSCSLIDRVEGDRVILDQPAAEAKQRIEPLERASGFFRDEDRATGPHMLNRAFSGTYEQ